jgi:hypothetical protein
MVEKTSHFDEQQIIEAVIDPSSLDVPSRRHLWECPECRAQKAALENRLARFGQISREQTTIEFRKPEIFQHESAGIFSIFKLIWEISPVFRMGVVFASLLILLLTPLTLKKDMIYTLDRVYEEMRQDDEFMNEVEKLEDTPFPHSYVEVAAPGDDKRETPSPGARNDGMTEDGGPRNA